MKYYNLKPNNQKQNKTNNMNTITKGTKLELNIEGTIRTYEVKWIENGIYTLFNKYICSLHVDFNFILEHLTNNNNTK